MTDDSRFMAFVALAANAPARGEAIVVALSEAFETDGALPELVGDTAGKTAGEAVLIQVGKTIVTVIYIGQPMPSDALEEALAKDRIWPDARDALAGQKAHYIVSHLNVSEVFAEVRQDAIAVTQVCAALCALAPVIAVNWTAAETITPADSFLEKVTGVTDGKWPLTVWVNLLPFGGAENARGQPMIGMLTKGLAPFVGREIEFALAALPPAHVIDRTLNMAGYLLSNGATLADGDTVGISEIERLHVRHADLEQTGIKVFRLTPDREGQPDGLNEPSDGAAPGFGSGPKPFGKRGL